MQPVPIGIQTFEDLIQGGFVYVDKTRYLYELVKESKGTYFLSRPRRFGKSLTLSTLDAIFRGKKELFKGLWIYESGYEWKQYPVIRLDMSSINRDNAVGLTKDIKARIQEIAEDYEVKIGDDETLERGFMTLIKMLATKYKEKVVILIDEYDKPIIDRLSDPERAQGNREVLRSFYGIMKGQDEYIRFIFLTGVTKFSKVSVFSGLNNLKDITMDARYGTMLGYTQEELERNFEGYIQRFAQSSSVSRKELLEAIRVWYNGFRFSEEDKKVYNPYSTLLLFDQQAFKNYWFETATPDFVINILKMRDDVFEIEETAASEESFSTFEIENLNVRALLLQTGYYTIRDYDPHNRTYVLGYPNKEVEIAFTKYLIAALEKQERDRVDSDLIMMRKYLEAKEVDRFFELLHGFIAGIPYTMRIRDEEKYYQGMIYTMLRCLGIHVHVEMTTNKGRIDAVIEMPKQVYVIEFKLNGSKEEALKQIKEQGYSEQYKNRGKDVTLVGVAIDREKRNISGWTME